MLQRQERKESFCFYNVVQVWKVDLLDPGQRHSAGHGELLIFFSISFPCWTLEEMETMNNDSCRSTWPRTRAKPLTSVTEQGSYPTEATETPLPVHGSCLFPFFCYMVVTMSILVRGKVALESRFASDWTGRISCSGMLRCNCKQHINWQNSCRRSLPIVVYVFYFCTRSNNEESVLCVN